MPNNTNAFNLNHGFEIFLGFLYSVLVGLVLKTAYLKSSFNSIVPIALTFLLLVFFAYDWLSRTRGFLKMPEKMLEKTDFLYFLKIFLDLAVVYFLLVFSLKFVEAYSTSLQVQDDYFYYSMAIFAIFSGAWNALLIFIFKGFNKSHIITLVKGHLDQDVIEMFPQLIKKWQAKIILIVEQKHKEMETLKVNGVFDTSESKYEYRKKWRKLDRDLGFKLYLRCFLKKPHQLFLPYLFVFHIVALNFVLGVFIVITTCFGKISLSSQLLSAFGLSLPVWGLAVGVFLSSIFLTWHFMSSKNMEVTLMERFGCWILFISTIYGYSLCTSVGLVILVAVQQVIANIIMSAYFKPSANAVASIEPSTDAMELIK